MSMCLGNMGVKKWAFWLLVVGVVSLVVGAVIGALTFEPVEFLAQIA